MVYHGVIERLPGHFQEGGCPGAMAPRQTPGRSHAGEPINEGIHWEDTLKSPKSPYVVPSGK